MESLVFHVDYVTQTIHEDLLQVEVLFVQCVDVQTTDWFVQFLFHCFGRLDDIREAAPSDNIWIYFEPSLWTKR